MSVSTHERTARLRRSRTRTPKISSREALVISTLAPHQYDLRPVCASLICPDCRTWCPITGIQAKVQKLVPHHAGTAREDAPIRCSGSNRRIIVDVTYEEWWRHLEQGVAETMNRRSTRVTTKPGEEGLWLLRELYWASSAAAVRRTDIQRVHDVLEMTLQQRSPTLTSWEHAELESAITMLATQFRRLNRGHPVPTTA